MIQRIQSIYFLLAAILMAVTVCSPLLAFNDYGIFDSWGIFSKNIVYPTWGIITFAILGSLLPFVNIFLFKNRKRQIGIGHITTLIILLFYITAGVYIYFFQTKYDVTIQNMQYGIIMPIVALVFNILAVMNIKKDEKKVRSLDRIR